jgi:transketolase
MTSAAMPVQERAIAFSGNDLRRMANALRALAMDAIERAGSGHPGMPLGMADVAAVLFAEHLNFDPADPAWPNRDRLVLSAGHGSILLYAALHLAGYADVTLDDLQRFRGRDARLAGHPEYGHVAGVETTTGPLGQGLATAVGLALGERMLAARTGDLIDHFTYVIASDGDLMEGLSQEAIALAGRLGLSRLVVLFDDNDVCIDGRVSMVEATDQLARFAASGWNACRVDGHDAAAVSAAIAAARASDRPSLIACRTRIGYGAPTKEDSPKAHAAPLGPDEVAGARRTLGWNAAPFEIPASVVAPWRAAAARGAAGRVAWQARLAAAPTAVRQRLEHRTAPPPAGLDAALAAAKAALGGETAPIATRRASEIALAIYAAAIDDIVSGSADLTSATLNKSGLAAVTPADFSGRFVHWGIREHAMAAALNGLALSGFIPVGATFLVFSDYFRPALRLSALMKLGTIEVLTHDSIGVGEDGATHQPVEHLAALRAMPNLLVLRPADAVETAECWALALARRDGPSVLALTRQPLPLLRGGDAAAVNRSAEGAYEIAAADGEAEVSLFASGSEVHIALAARNLLQADGIAARVVSVPSLELFEARDAGARRAVIGRAPVRVAVEAAVRQGWDRLIGDDGVFVGMSGFGGSGSAADLYAKFGITAQAVAEAARRRVRHPG